MNADTRNFYRDILSRTGMVYLIPVYQRNYSWTTRECELLLEDIVKLIKGINKKHFIGTIVAKMDDGDYYRYNIIDGQQRFTTITLMLKALMDSSDDKMLIEEITEALTNKFSDTKIKLVPNPNDKVVYDLIMENRVDEVDKTSTIYLNYIHFLNYFNNIDISSHEFFTNIKKLEIVEIVLTREEDAQTIFESINSTGVSLSVGDLIRNFLLMGREYEIQTRLFNKYWNSFETSLGSDGLSYFFECFLYTHSKSTINKARMYDAFKEFYNNFDHESDESVFEYIKTFVDAYLIINQLKDSGDIKIDIALTDYKQINSIQTPIFLMYPFKWYREGFITIDELVYTIELFNSYNFRRQIIRTGTGVSKVYAVLHGQILRDMNNGCTYIEALLMNFVYRRLNTSSSFPMDNVVIEMLKTRDLYKNFSNTKFLLMNLNYGLSSFKGRKNYDDELVTIEHIMPQKLSNKWLNQLDEISIEKHSEYCHDLGNLTLTSINSEVSNSSFEDKKEFYEEESHFKLNNYFKNKILWDVEAIEKRSEELAILTTKVWAYPTFDKERIKEIDKTYQLSNCDIISLNYFDNLDIFTGRKPKGVIIDGIFKEETSYALILKYVVEHISSKNRELFIEKVINNELNKKKGSDLYHYHIIENKVLYPWCINNIYTSDSASARYRMWLVSFIAISLDINIEICILKEI